MSFAAASPIDKAFEQRVAGQPVGAVQAGAGGLAQCIQPGYVGACIQVDNDAAAGVVGRRHDRDRFLRDVDAQFETARVDVGEVFVQEGFALVRHVEEDAVEAESLHLVVDGAGNDVARRQFQPRVVRRS